MSSSHVGPKDATKAAHEMNAECFIPMHYGTFDLSGELLGDAYRGLQKLQKESGNQELIVLAGTGEVIKIKQSIVRVGILTMDCLPNLQPF